MQTAAETQFKELKKQIADAKKTMQVTAKKLFTDMSASLFTEFPQLISFKWDQYTPYWNDGDVCEFSANTDYVTVEVKMEDGKIVKSNMNMGDLTWEDEDGIEYDLPQSDVDKYEKECDKVEGKVVKFLRNFEDEDLEIMFGDHKEITVKRDGKVHVDDCEHD